MPGCAIWCCGSVCLGWRQDERQTANNLLMKMMSEKSSTGDDDCARGRGGAVRKATIARL